jgi:hypothetical protein
MNRICLTLLLAAGPAAAMAADAVVVLSPVAAYANPEAIAENIKSECKLPEYQTDVFRRELEAQGVSVKLGEKDEVPGTGRFVQLRIQHALSSGNAFIGHRKHVTTSVKLFENGKEIARSTHARDSMGGFGGGFKGSCTVLERCADTLAKDLTAWLKRELAKSSSATSATETVPSAEAPASAPSASTQ